MKKFVIILIGVFIGFNLGAQTTAEEIFKIKYAALYGEFRPDGSVKVTDENIEIFRKQYNKLNEGLQDIEKQIYKVATAENLTVFELKELKDLEKDGQIENLQKLINQKKIDLKKFLGENHEYGVSKDECLMNYSNLKQSLNREDYKAACNFWRELYYFWPNYKYHYSKGDVLMRTKISMVHKEVVEAYKNAVKAQEAKKMDEAVKFAEEQKRLMAEKELWIDTLLQLYDKRIKFLGDDPSYGEGYLLGKKGGYIYEYRKDTHLSDAYKILKKSIEIEKENSLFNVIKDFFDVSMDMTRANKIKAEDLVNDYSLSTDILKQSTEKFSEYIEKENKKSTPNAEKISNWEKVVSNNEKVSEYITNKFATDEVSKCEFLIPAFKGNFDTRKTDKAWLKTVTGILSWKECTNDPFYGKAAEALYKLEPSADAAFKLALFHLKMESYTNAAKYFEEAYTLETKNAVKAEYYYYAAIVAYAQNQYSNSRSLALKAAGLKSNYGKPYILIAKLYAASVGSCGKDAFEKSAVYWVVVDKLYKAKSIDAGVSDEANSLINSYSSRFPNSEEGFMRGIYKGNTYKVECWIQETTTARY